MLNLMLRSACYRRMATITIKMFDSLIDTLFGHLQHGQYQVLMHSEIIYTNIVVCACFVPHLLLQTQDVFFSHFRGVVGALHGTRRAFDMDVITDAHTRGASEYQSPSRHCNRRIELAAQQPDLPAFSREFTVQRSNGVYISTAVRGLVPGT